jgi:hypothetical protein
MTVQAIFNLAVVVFTVGNLAAMGLELNVHETVRTLRSTRFVAARRFAARGARLVNASA